MGSAHSAPILDWAECAPLLSIRFRTTLEERLGPLEEERREKVRQALREYITACWGWDTFITQTFSYEMSRDQADVALARVQAFLAKRYRLSHGFLGAELHRSGSVHLHGLFGTASPIRRSALWEALHSRFGFARVVPARSHEAVAAYCTKYVTKSLAEWLLW